MAEPFRSRLFEHIRQHARGRKIYVDRINGDREHLHCLVALDAHQSIEKTAQFLKGESSFWFNSQWGRAEGKLLWQEDYMAVSVSESVVPTLRAYIDGQPGQHDEKSFDQEYQELIHYYGFKQPG